jgi:hypothetical protein
MAALTLTAALTLISTLDPSEPATVAVRPAVVERGQPWPAMVGISTLADALSRTHAPWPLSDQPSSDSERLLSAAPSQSERSPTKFSRSGESDDQPDAARPGDDLNPDARNDRDSGPGDGRRSGRGGSVARTDAVTAAIEGSSRAAEPVPAANRPHAAGDDGEPASGQHRPRKGASSSPEGDDGPLRGTRPDTRAAEGDGEG